MHLIKMRKNVYHFNRSDDLQPKKKIGVEKIDHALRLDPNLYC